MLAELDDQDGDLTANPKWFNSPVTKFAGSLGMIHSHIPEFERRDFRLIQPDNKPSVQNEHFDTIVRLPFNDDKRYVPIGVVSKNYALLPHTAVLGEAAKAFEKAGIPPQGVEAELLITEFGERMALSLYLPGRYNFDPGDGHTMSLRLECLNSIDGSTRFRVLLGWFRMVCGNGMIIGVTQSDLRSRHRGNFLLSNLNKVLNSGLKDIEKEKKNFKDWRETKIKPDRLLPWADSDLRKAWGFKAAARTLHIARYGTDAEIIGSYKKQKPSTLRMMKTNSVPGAPPQCGNLFDVSQILAWLAKERRDLQERIEWREQIPELLQKLIRPGKAPVKG